MITTTSGGLPCQEIYIAKGACGGAVSPHRRNSPSPAVQPQHMDGHVDSRAQRVTPQTIRAVVRLCDALSADSNTPHRRSSTACKKRGSRWRRLYSDEIESRWSFARRRGSSQLGGRAPQSDGSSCKTAERRCTCPIRCD